MATRAQSFSTINGAGTLIIYRDRALSTGRRIDPAILRKSLEQAGKGHISNWWSPEITVRLAVKQ